MRRTSLLAMAALALAGTAAAQSSLSDETQGRLAFDGPYLGISIGLHTIIGGALVNGVDYLAQDSRPAVVIFGGWRKEFDNGFVLGLEGGLGFEDGDLRLEDPSAGLAIDYRNNFQFRYGGHVGWRLDDDKLLFAYLSETKRDFDVAIASPSGAAQQRDGQGLLRYGLGLELDLDGPFALRGLIGSSRADFGDRPLNREPDRPLEFELGTLTQF